MIPYVTSWDVSVYSADVDACLYTISDATFPLPVSSNSIDSSCARLASLLGTGSGNMASNIGPPNAVDRRFDDLN